MDANATIVGAGPNDDTEAQVDRYHRALRVSLRPWEHDSGGHYRFAARSGAITGTAVVAGAPLFSYRWAGVTSFAALLRLKAFWIPTVLFTAAQELGLDLMHVTGFTASDSAGTLVTPVPVKKSMPASSFADCRIAAATLLTAGTRTLDPTPLEVGGGLVNQVNAAAGTAYINPSGSSYPAYGFDYDPLIRGEMPLILTPGEGFLVRNTVVFPAAGTATLVVVGHVVEFPPTNQLIIPGG
jgi:hypothetical protein